MRKKHMLIGLLSLVLMLFIVGTVNAAGSSESVKAREIAVAVHVEPGDLNYRIAQRFSDAIEANSGGRLKVTILGLEVGGERDHLEGASVNEYQIALGGSMPLSLYAPKFAGSDLPFVYSNTQESRGNYEGELGALMQEELIKNGNLRLVGLSVRNPRQLTSRKPIRVPADLAGVRMRVPEIAPWIVTWTEMGALPSPIAWAEVYTSLQTGVIDMQENPVDFIHAGRIYEVQDYINLTNHVHSFFHWLMNEEFYQSLTEEDRKVVLDAVKEATTWGNDLTQNSAAEFLQKLQDEGMEVVRPDFAQFRAAAEPAIRKIAANMHPAAAAYVLSFFD